MTFFSGKAHLLKAADVPLVFQGGLTKRKEGVIMAWRPTSYLIEGVLDNGMPGKVSGWMRFTGMEEKIVFDLEGNFHRDIRGAKVRLRGDGETRNADQAKQYLEGFAQRQTGKVGDMTAGQEPVDYVDYPYFEWYSPENGRCVIELEADQVEILTPPIPACESDPLSRNDQAENMAEYLSGMAAELGLSSQQTICVGNTAAVERAKKVAENDRRRGMKLLPPEIRENLPPLYSQDGKGGKAVVHCKFFTPDANWTWYVLEGEPVQDESGREIDFRYFGLVDGMERELGYFMLGELEEIRGPLGLPIERDLHWRARTLAEIDPDRFKSSEKGR